MDQTDVIKNVLLGRLEELPPLPPTTVKIYLCANYEEFDEERRLLWHEVLPDLQKHCVRHGLDVILVDMLEGCDHDPVLDQEQLKRRIEEINAAHNESIFPFFLGLVGMKYGGVSLPNTFDETEFQHIRDHASKSGQDISLLDEWYTLDRNRLPPVYVLMPVSSKFPNFPRICTDPRQHTKELNAWSDMHRNLLEMIQTSASIVYEEGLINVVHHKRQERFFTSVLESEITHALHLAPEGCLFVIRDIVGIEYEQNKAACYVDTMSDLSANESKLIKLRRMRHEIESICLSENKVLMKTNWKDGGIDLKKHSEHKEYLENFSALLSTKLRYMIDCSLEKKQSTALPIKKYQLCLESLVNLHHCKTLYKKYSEPSFEEVVAKVQSLLITGTRQEHQVILIKGPTGSGKSMIVSKICHRARELFGKETILIPRFINILSKPPTDEHLFRNICEQINTVLQQNIHIKNYDCKKLKHYFNGLLNRVSKGNRHLLIVLGGINQIRETNSFETAGLEWITNNLPPKIHIIATASTSDTKSSILKQVEGKMKSAESVVQLEPLSENICVEIIKSNMKQFKQRVTPEQEITLRKALVESKHLLHVANMTQIVRCWQSNLVPGENDLPFNVLEFTKKTLFSLESKYGDQIMGAFCRCICLSQCGLSEMEILDLLSCNNDILLTCFPVKLPSVLRFPHYIWSDIKHEMGNLLVARYLHKKTLLSWNSECIAVIQERYMQEPEQVLTGHSDIAHLFLETWTNSKSTVDTDRRIFVIENTHRFVNPQPLLYSETRYNERRIYELWYQLMKSGDIDALKEHAVINFEYLMATIDNQSLHDLLENLHTVLASHVDAEILLVTNTLKEVRMVLEISPIQLANELIGRLRELKEFFPNNIDSLVTQCMEWCDGYCSPLLVPLTSWLTDSHTPFITSLAEFSNISCIVPLVNNQHVIVAEGNLITMYHLATKRPVKRFEGHSGKITCLTLTKAAWLLGSGSDDCSVIIWHVKEGTLVKRIRKHASAVTSLTINRDDEICASGHDDGIVCVVDIKAGTVITKLSMHSCEIRSVLFNNNGSILLSASADGMIMTWCTDDWSRLSLIENCQITSIRCLDLSEDNTFILTGSENGGLHVISFTTGSWIQELSGHQGKIQSVKICSDCHHAIAACSFGFVYLFNFRTTKLMTMYRGHHSDVNSVCLSGNESLIFSASKEEVIVWSLIKRCAADLQTDCHSGPISCLAITKDNKQVISGSVDGLLKMWNLDVGDFADNLVGHSGPITCVAVAPDNTFVVSGSRDKTLIVWNLPLAKILIIYRNHECELSNVHVLSDSKLVLSIDVNQTLHVWRVDDAQSIQVYSTAFYIHTVSPDSRYIISGAGDKSVRIWKLLHGLDVKVATHSEKITFMTCTQDSKYLVTGSEDKSLKIWELETGKLTQVLVEHGLAVRCIIATSDNVNVISGGDDSMIMVWNFYLGSLDRKLAGHNQSISNLRLTSDESILISASMDNTIRAWDYTRGIQIAMFNMHGVILDFVMSNTAHRIIVHLANINKLATLCLHNTPATEKDKQNGNVQLLNSCDDMIDNTSDPDTVYDTEKSPTLPIKPKPPMMHRVSAVYPLPARRRRYSSESSDPQIIQHSPMKASIQSTFRAHEKSKTKTKINGASRKYRAAVTPQPSGLCGIL